MSAFASLILLVVIAALAMAVVAYSNYKTEQTKKVRLRLQIFRARAEELEDIVMVLDKICESRTICKFVNDEIIKMYEIMIEIDSSARYLQAGLANAKIRSEELSNEIAPRQLSRLCNSDAQIARLRAYIKEACRIIRVQHTQGKLSTTELQSFTLELEWHDLQVYAVSNIVQGHKAYTKHDIITANAFYKKAQTELIKSTHPDERRQQMIKQLTDILFGRRMSIDETLMPENEFNPKSEATVLSNEQQKALEKMLESADPAMIPEITAAIMQR
ncbi:MAG: hypothetical protein ACJAUP_000317 [Cellvibrionaceae bacterium]|jgi:hypothetical protein